MRGETSAIRFAEAKKLLDYETLETYYDIIDFVFKVSRAINKTIENTEI